MTGRNRALLDTVSSAIKDDLLRVKEALDIFLRGQNADPHDLEAQADMLNRVGDTLGMLGLGVPRRVVGEQREVLEGMARSQRPVDEGTARRCRCIALRRSIPRRPHRTHRRSARRG
jgi:chemosensory pili system protein ChpA (sensor histidine kinase/response regulator)